MFQGLGVQLSKHEVLGSQKVASPPPSGFPGSTTAFPPSAYILTFLEESLFQLTQI